MSLQYIRDFYSLPNLRRGTRVEYCGRDNMRKRGTVTSASNHVFIRLDGEKHSRPYHPRDEYLIYLWGTSSTVGASQVEP